MSSLPPWVKYRDMSIHLREKHESLDGVTLNRLISNAEAYLSLREGSPAAAVQPTVAAVQGGNGQKGQPKPSNSGPAKKWQGRGKKKGPKPVAKAGNQSQNLLDPAAIQYLYDFVKWHKKTQGSGMDGDSGGTPCPGTCWGCGQMGHYKAQCPNKGSCRAVTGKGADCPQEPGQKCACPCREHEHFGYARGKGGE